MTIAEDWVDTYTLVEPPRRAAINLARLMHYQHMLKDPKKYVFQENVVHDKIFDIDGIPYVQTRIRFVNACKKAGDNAPRLYIMLNQMFRAEAIKVLWPELHLMWYNFNARKQARRERCEVNAALKKIPKQDRKLHKEVEALTTHTSIRQFAKFSI